MTAGLSLLSAGIAVYFLLPRVPAQAVVPGTAAFAAALIVALLARSVRVSKSALLAGVAMVAIAAGARVAITVITPPAGWLARYYANDSWSGAPEWSSDFRRGDATRIDQALSFTNDEFPTHYLNGRVFVTGTRREVTEPMSVEWSGFTDMASARDVDVAVIARGTAVVVIDGREVASAAGTAPADAHARVQLSAGAHQVKVRYLKPAGADGLLHVRATDAATGAPLVVTSESRGGGLDRRAAGLLSGLADAVIAALFVLVTAFALRSLWRDEARRAWVVVAVTAFVLFGAQGLWQASPFATHFLTLSAGDDWLGFESRARDILQTGPLMTLGQPLGEGVPYFYHPFYSYFLATVHALTGESLFGPIFFQFLILAATALIMWSVARELFGAWPALAGFAALIVIFELDFARYYTITLLSENLYILTVTLTLAAFVRWARTGERRALWLTGICAGLSSVTRPAMMMYFAPAVVIAATLAWRRRPEVRAAVAAVAVLAVAWLAVIAPFTIRNWVVARRAVLISDGLGGAFIVHNVPASVDPNIYLSGYRGGIFAGLAVLARVAGDHPGEFAAIQVKKLGFSLGMVHWHGDYRPHPELVVVTALYLLMCIFSTTMRSPPLWPVHAFVIAHVASMGLTSPWNYGYRMILPPFVYMTTLSVAAAAAALAPRFGYRLPA